MDGCITSVMLSLLCDLRCQLHCFAAIHNFFPMASLDSKVSIGCVLKNLSSSNWSLFANHFINCEFRHTIYIRFLTYHVVGKYAYWDAAYF